MRKACKHGYVLPRGLLCSRGYLFIRLFPKAPYAGPMPFLEGCGPHDRMRQSAAEIKLSHFRKLMILGEFNVDVGAESLTVREVCGVYLKQIEKEKKIKGLRVVKSIIARAVLPFLGNYKWDLLTPELARRWRQGREEHVVDAITGAKISFSTVNREQRVLSAMINTVTRWVKTRVEGIPLIRLPKENPFEYVQNPSEEGLARDRVPSREEMKEAKAWCAEHDPELWQAIVQSTVTMLRKGDFAVYQKTGQENGVQGKTGRKFKVRAKFPAPVNLTNARYRWEELQKAMGWQERLDDGALNPRHTVWHDMRHWGPTILVEYGYGDKLIQKLTGHATEKMVNRYTNLREEKLVEAVGVLQREMEAL